MTADEQHVMAVQLRDKIHSLRQSLDEHEVSLRVIRSAAQRRALRELLIDLSCDLSRFLLV